MNAGTKNGGDHYVTKEVFQAFGTYGALLTPSLRAAYYRVLGQVDHESAVQLSLNGHTYYGLRDIATDASDFYLLCDPATGQAVGELWGPDLIDLWHFAVVDRQGQTG